MPSIQRSEPSSGETFGEVWNVAERAERHRRYAKLFSKAMSTTDPIEQARLIAEIRMLLREAKEPTK